MTRGRATITAEASDGLDPRLDILSAVAEASEGTLTVTWTVRGDLAAEPEAGTRHLWEASITDSGANRVLGVMREGGTVSAYFETGGPEGGDFKRFQDVTISGNTVTLRFPVADVGAHDDAVWMVRSRLDRDPLEGDWVAESEDHPFLR